MKQVIFLLGLIALFAGGLMPAPARAEEQIWLQIEALPTLREAEDRARAYGALFPDVAGFRVKSGWYAIVLGPHAARDLASRRLTSLKREGLIPADSYLTETARLGARYWPVGAAAPQDAPAPTPEAAAPEAPPSPVLADETPQDARRAEAALTGADRQALQTALQWFGHYSAAIDGAFGPGTRKSMAAWQEANGLEPTGVLTTRQREVLLAAYAKAQAELGLEKITEAEAGIEITLPMALVHFDHYEPPFVHFTEKDGSGVRVILISQPGDQSTLEGLYDLLQTLEVVPPEGERMRGERSFTISGRSPALASHSYAEVSKGLVKGYMLIWNPADDERMARVLAAMQSSFRALGDRALDPGIVPMSEGSRKGLLSGLEIRHPELSRSGFFVSDSGAVLTTPEAVTGCSRITLDLGPEADVTLTDAALGVALLTPKKPLAPRQVAEFLTGAPRLGAEIAVSGYSYEDRLPAPTLTFGTFEEDSGLNGEAGLARLAVGALPGDAGGPVLDAAGTVLGMLLPRAAGSARQLPADVNHAVFAPALVAKLAEAGITPRASTRQGQLSPEALNALAGGMTVLVSCWK